MSVTNSSTGTNVHDGLAVAPRGALLRGLADALGV
jgi:hypothetical protein